MNCLYSGDVRPNMALTMSVPFMSAVFASRQASVYFELASVSAGRLAVASVVSFFASSRAVPRSVIASLR